MTMNSRATIQWSRITLSLARDRLSLLWPELIGMADQLLPWAYHCLCLLMVGVCLLAVTSLFSSILIWWSFAPTAVRQHVTGLFWISLVPLCKIHHLPQQRMIASPWCLAVRMTHYYHSPLGQNRVHLQPDQLHCHVKEQVPTFLSPFPYSLSAKIVPVCLQNSHWSVTCLLCCLPPEMQKAPGVKISSRYKQFPAPPPSAQVIGVARSEHLVLSVVSHSRRGTANLWWNSYWL